MVGQKPNYAWKCSVVFKCAMKYRELTNTIDCYWFGPQSNLMGKKCVSLCISGILGKKNSEESEKKSRIQ